MALFHLVENEVPLSGAAVITANCGEPVLNPVAIAIEAGTVELKAYSSLGPLCRACTKIGFSGRHYRYTIANGQEAIAKGISL